MKLSYRYGVDAVTVIMYRMLFALPLFIALTWWASRGAAPLTRRDWLAVCGLGFCGYYVASFLDFWGLQYVSAGLERLILYLNPTIVLLLGVLLFKQHATRGQWAALGVSYLGVLVVFSESVSLGGPNVVFGSFLVFLSAISYSIYLVMSGASVQRLGAQRLTGLASGVACILCISHFFVLRSVESMHVAPEVLGLAVLNAVFCTFVPILATMMAIQRIGAAASSQIGLIGPVSTVLLSVWLLDEPFTLWIAVGTVLVLSGVWLMTRMKRATR